MNGLNFKQLKRMLLGIALLLIASWATAIPNIGWLFPFVLVPAGLILVLVGFFGRDGPGYY